MYNPSFYQPYQPYTPQIQPQPQAPTQTPGGNTGIIWVQGKAGAQAYLVAPGQSVFLMDSENNRFFIKSADSSGMPHPLREFAYKEETPGNGKIESQEATPEVDLSGYVTKEEFEKAIKELKEEGGPLG